MFVHILGPNLCFPYAGPPFHGPYTPEPPSKVSFISNKTFTIDMEHGKWFNQNKLNWNWNIEFYPSAYIVTFKRQIQNNNAFNRYWALFGSCISNPTCVLVEYLPNDLLLYQFCESPN